MARLEAAARQPAGDSRDVDPEIADRHERLRGAAARALEALDAVIAEHG